MKQLKFIFITIFLCVLMNPHIVLSEKKQWAQYDKYENENKNMAQIPDVVFIGNSITYNWVKYVPEFFETNNYVGRGISGQTTEQILVRFQNDVVALHPKIVVILAGINDIAQNNGPISNKDILNNIISMCDIATINGIVPILCSILPCDHFSWQKIISPAERVVEMNELIKEYAETKGLLYVDYYGALATSSGALNPKYTHDGCHPTKDGYDIMMPIVQLTIQGVLNKMK